MGDKKRRRLIWTRDLGPPRYTSLLLADTTKDMPPILAALVRPFVIMGWICLGQLIVLLIAPALPVVWEVLVRIPPVPVGLLCYCGTLSALFFVNLLLYRRVRMFRQRVRRADYRLCLHCGYRLTGLRSQHACPECGVEFSIEDVRKEWQRWFDKRERKAERPSPISREEGVSG